MAWMPDSVRWVAAAMLLFAAAGVAPVSAATADAGPLFAGLDGGVTFPAPATDEGHIESELVGFIVDGQDRATRIVYRVGDRYYLPADLLGELGVRGVAQAGHLYLATPGGEVEARPHYFRDLYGDVYFLVDMLDEVLKIRWEFSAEKYAFVMTLPWWQQGAPGAQAADRGTDVQFGPSAFGITQIRLDHTQIADQDQSFSYSNLLLRGRLAGGTWRSELVQQEGRAPRAENYYWLKDFEHVQALVGNQQVLLNPLLPAMESTGGQALYSSSGIPFDPYHDQTRSQYVRRFGIPTEAIEGTAQPGTIAELRIDGRPVARTRVKLDGTYRFDDVRIQSLQFQTVRVHILDQRSMVELEMQDYTRTPIDLLLDARQTVVFAGAGSNGNPLDPDYGTDGASAYGLVRYGVTDGLTLEAGVQSAGGLRHEVAAVTASFGRRWAATASVAQHEGEYGYSTDLYGRGERWQLTARLQDFREGFRAPLSPAARYSDLRYEYWLTPGFSLGMRGRSTRSEARSDDYLLPGLTWRFGRRNMARVWPDFDGSYRVDVRSSFRQRDWLEFVHDSYGESAEYRYYRGPQVEFFGRLRRVSEPASGFGELGAVWYPNPYDDRSLLGASVLAGDRGMGYRFNWQATVLPGLYSNLEIRDEPVATEYSDSGLQVRWTVSLDLAISGGRPLPARNDFIQGRTGSIGGRLLLADGGSIAGEGLDKVVILIDGRPNTAVLRGRYFFVRNVPPGVYNVALDAEYLPMNLTPERVTYRVRVAAAATTAVDFVVNQEFGVSGRVTGSDGAGAADVTIDLRDVSDRVVTSVRTDTYGYYRISGLVPGTYRLRAGTGKAGVERSLRIEDAFVFDADLVLAADAAP